MAKFSIPDKLNLAQLPTPIQHLPMLSKRASRFSEVNLFVKRDDLTHGPAAGNKVRKLEFLLAEALRLKKKTIFTCGGVQSNHARATAILCRQLGLECVLFLQGRPPEEAFEANLLLDKLVGASVRYVNNDQYENVAKTFLDASEEFRARDGVTPLFIPEGGSNDIGSMGYLTAFAEITAQAGKNGLPEKFSSVVVANGSGGTHAGLLLGSYASEWDSFCRVISFNISRSAARMAETVKQVMVSTVQRYRLPFAVMPADIQVVDGYVGPGYAKAAPELYDFIVGVAQEDGIILDPVYTGKALYGLIGELTASPERAKAFGKNILFVHTGGLPSLFAHGQAFTEALKRAQR